MTPGVVFALAVAVNAFTQPGDHVIIQPPVYYPFRLMIPDNGRKMATSPLLCENGRYTMDDAGIKRLVEQDAKLWLDLGTMFGPKGSGFVRMNLASPKALIEQACDRLEQAVGKLAK